MKNYRINHFALTLVLLVGSQFLTLHAGLKIASSGNALTQIYVSDAENTHLMESAETLAKYLEQMSSSPIPVSTDAFAGKGIFLALPESVPEAMKKELSDLKSLPTGGYLLDANNDRVLLIGNSDKAVTDATYDLLQRMGCRWLLPSERWTIIPEQANLSAPDVRILTSPDFTYRRLWYAYGLGQDESKHVLAADYKRWVEGNRLGGVATYKIGHTYNSTLMNHKEAFEAHPEYFAMQEDGNRLPFKPHQSLCYSNPDVGQFFVEDKLVELTTDKENNPYSYAVSMDPNDGSQECYCETCQALGNGSDQALFLANTVARALREKFPDAVATMYVYASHRLPPENVEAEPNVEVQVAMGFNKTQYSLPELVKLWREKVEVVGIRDYMAVMAWDWGLPGRARATSFQYVKREIPIYYSWGARSYNAEMNANWGAFGPACYVAAQLLWDHEADADALYDEYFRLAFGAGAEPMKQFYANASENSLLTRQNLHEWFDLLRQAMAACSDESQDVKERLIDMASYLHYVRLYRDWEHAVKSQDADLGYQALKPLLEFTWRTRERGMVHAYALQRRLVNSGHPLIRPLREHWRFNDLEAVWKNPDALTDQELIRLFQIDLKETPPDHRIKKFSTALQPAFPGDVQAEDTPAGAIRHNSTWHMLVEQDEHLQFELPMSGVRFDYRLEVFDLNNNLVWEDQESISRTSERYQQKPFSLKVSVPKKGQYRLVFTAGEDYVPSFPENLRVMLEISETSHPMFRGFGPGYMYVPKGTQFIYAKTDSRFSLVAPSSKIRKDWTTADEDPKLECIAIPVGDDDGKIWEISSHISGKCYVLNIPPYMATDPQRLLIPQGMTRPEE